MELAATTVVQILQAKGVDALYHANTVQTSCTFLSQGYLMARGVVGERGLPQTPQQSDDLDKRYGVWFDIFLDGVDIHDRASRRNLYGPVLFVFDMERIAQDWTNYFWVTKTNPQAWQPGNVHSDRWFTSIVEFTTGYQRGNFGKMCVLRQTGGLLRLQPFLQKIVVDYHRQMIGGVEAYSRAVGALSAAAKVAGLTDIPIEPRVCRPGCNCQNEYTNMYLPMFEKVFAP